MSGDWRWEIKKGQVNNKWGVSQIAQELQYVRYEKGSDLRVNLKNGTGEERDRNENLTVIQGWASTS